MVELVHRRAGMDVRIDQPRENGLAGEVDHLRVVTLDGEHVGVCADAEDLAVFDRDGRRDGETLVDGDDLAVMEDEVSRGSVGGEERATSKKGDDNREE